MTLHIGILQTGSVRPEFVERFGEYPHMFRELFLAVDPSLRFTDYDVQVAVPDDVACDAYVVTGSKHSVYEDEEWIRDLARYVGDVLKAQRKVVGVCFGHQLIAHFFGGRVAAADAGWAVGVHTSEIYEPPPWMDSDCRAVSLLSSHKDQVVEVPPGARVYMGNDFCPVGGFSLGDHVVTVQGHPEFDKAYAGELMQVRREMLGDALVTRGLKSLEASTQGLDMARWLLAFMAGTQPAASDGR